MAWAADPLVDEPKHLFEHFVHVSLERDSVSKELLFKIVKHQGFGNELPKDVQGFCFPDQAFIPPSKDPIGLFYTFVLTDFGGNRMYGFCRRILPPLDPSVSFIEFRYPHVLCVITYWPWFETFSQLLEIIEECVWVQRAHISLDSFLDAMRAHPIPPPLRPLERIPFPTTELRLRLKPVRPPSREDHPLFGMASQELLESLSVENLGAIFVALLSERRILVTSSSIPRLSTCIHALVNLLHPFEWHHIFIPLIPKGMLSYCTAPMPFFIGAHTSAMPSIRHMPLERILFVDLDTNSVSSGDPTYEAKLPSSLDKWLSQALTLTAQQYTLSKGRMEPFAFSQLTQCFQFVLHHLVAGYWNFFGVNAQGLFRFDKDLFILKKSKDMRPLLELFCNSQMFERWIIVRERLAERGVLPKDPFETELRAFGRINPALVVSRDTPTQTKTTVKDRLLESYKKQKKKYLAAQAKKGGIPRELSKPTAASAALSQIAISGPVAFRHSLGLETASPSHSASPGAVSIRPKRVELSDPDIQTGLAVAAASAADPQAPITQHPLMRNRIRDPERLSFAILHAAFNPHHRHPSSPSSPPLNPLFSAVQTYPNQEDKPLPPSSRTSVRAVPIRRPSDPSSAASAPAPPRRHVPSTGLPSATPVHPASRPAGLPHSGASNSSNSSSLAPQASSPSLSRPEPKPDPGALLNLDRTRRNPAVGRGAPPSGPLPAVPKQVTPIPRSSSEQLHQLHPAVCFPTAPSPSPLPEPVSLFDFLNSTAPLASSTPHTSGSSALLSSAPPTSASGATLHHPSSPFGTPLTTSAPPFPASNPLSSFTLLQPTPVVIGGGFSPTAAPFYLPTASSAPAMPTPTAAALAASLPTFDDDFDFGAFAGYLTPAAAPSYLPPSTYTFPSTPATLPSTTTTTAAAAPTFSSATTIPTYPSATAGYLSATASFQHTPAPWSQSPGLTTASLQPTHGLSPSSPLLPVTPTPAGSHSSHPSLLPHGSTFHGTPMPSSTSFHHATVPTHTLPMTPSPQQPSPAPLQPSSTALQQSYPPSSQQLPMVPVPAPLYMTSAPFPHPQPTVSASFPPPNAAAAAPRVVDPFSNLYKDMMSANRG